MGYKVNLSSENICGFVNSFGVDNGVQLLKLAPTRLLVLHMVDVVAEVTTSYVAISKLVLDDHNDGCLDLFFWGGGVLLAPKVVLMQNFEGVVDSLSLVMLTQIFSNWKTNPCLSMISLASLEMGVRNAKSLVALSLMRLINSYCYPHSSFL